MTIEDIRAALTTAGAVRFPSVMKTENLSNQIETVQDYLILTAQTRGDLELARLHAWAAHDLLREQWDDLYGYQNLIEGKRTLAAVHRAKAAARPDLARGLQTSKYLIERLTEQIKRLEIDDKAASRVYTMLTGS